MHLLHRRSVGRYHLYLTLCGILLASLFLRDIISNVHSKLNRKKTMLQYIKRENPFICEITAQRSGIAESSKKNRFAHLGNGTVEEAMEINQNYFL